MFRGSRVLTLVAAATSILHGCAGGGTRASDPGAAAAAVPSVIPAVASAHTLDGSWRVPPSIVLLAEGGEPAGATARYLAELMARTTPLAASVVTVAEGAVARGVGVVRLVLDPASTVTHPEGYVLTIKRTGAEINARDARGLFYGAITLWQMVTAARPAESRASDDIVLAAVTITDHPRFAWRGFMLDSARHFMPPEFVKRLIDWMALHKLNVFHWHLTDDQGWRLEILKYPRLTEVGAWRIPAGAAGAAGRYGGYYTQDEVRDIVRYAAERYVTVVPEIEMPGHAQAAIASYPELGTEGTPPRVSADWGVHDYLFNVEESTFRFLEDVLTEVMALFPSPYIHVGGDEAVKNRWEASPRVRERMRELGVANAPALQSWFIARIERFLGSHGRKLIGWDEILEGGLPPRATVMSWRGEAGAIHAASTGHDVVMAPVPKLYLDYLQSELPSEPPGRPSIMPLAEVYAFEPVPAALDADASRHILGAQLNAWTEHMRTSARIEHNAFPRMAAIAEVLWSPREARDWAGFLERLPDQFARYTALNARYADSAFAVVFEVEAVSPTRVRIALTNQVGHGEIRYTLDGSEPDARSAVYRGPLQLDLPATVRGATFSSGRQLAASRERRMARESLLRRTDDELRSCAGKLPLRLEDDAPLEGERAVFNVDILQPCWIFPGAELDRVTRIAARVGQLPFNFQVGADAQRIPLPTPRTPHGELEVRIGSCDGEPAAVLPLAPAVGNAAVSELPPVALPSRPGRHDLCLSFTRGALEPMWVIDSVQLYE